MADDRHVEQVMQSMASRMHSPDLDREGECPCPACSAPDLPADTVAGDRGLLTLDRLGDWRLQMGIWKNAIIGKILEQDALVAERGAPIDCLGPDSGFWDRTRADMAGDFRAHGRGGYQPVPDWWALPHLPMAWREQALDEES